MTCFAPNFTPSFTSACFRAWSDPLDSLHSPLMQGQTLLRLVVLNNPRRTLLPYDRAHSIQPAISHTAHPAQAITHLNGKKILHCQFYSHLRFPRLQLSRTKLVLISQFSEQSCLESSTELALVIKPPNITAS